MPCSSSWSDNRENKRGKRVSGRKGSRFSRKAIGFRSNMIQQGIRIISSTISPQMFSCCHRHMPRIILAKAGKTAQSVLRAIDIVVRKIEVNELVIAIIGQQSTVAQLRVGNCAGLALRRH